MAVLVAVVIATGSFRASGNDVADDSARYFRIKVVDVDTQRGVPGVELTTVHHDRYVTDSSGLVAFDDPALLGRTVFFHVQSHGYEHQPDGFGYRGVRLPTKAGGNATVSIRRINIAERLYRITGGGIYRDSVLLGDTPPTKNPLLNADVLGSDSVQMAIFIGRMHWFWGDTNRPQYPLGNFHVPGATSLLPSEGGVSPGVGIDLEYFVDKDGFASQTCRMAGDGPTWIDGLVTVRDDDDPSRERLFAKYVKVRPPLSIYRQGICEFNPQTKQFEHRVDIDMAAPIVPFGHARQVTANGRTASNDGDFVYFADPWPVVRVRNSAASLQDVSRYEAWSYFKPGSRADAYELDRASDGQLVLGWKRDTLPVDAALELKLLAAGKLKPAERWFRLSDSDGRAVNAHRGSVAFNAHRQKWVMIFTQHFGTSVLGEVWYSEAPALMGPWDRAVKIVTHDKYSFYNPVHHPEFDQADGRLIYFEGTFTTTFSGNDTPLPRYDYNQIMYRLDLADPRVTGEFESGSAK